MKLIVCCNNITPRLQYSCDLLLGSALGINFTIKTTIEEIDAEAFILSYLPQHTNNNYFRITSHPLLFETGIHEQQINCFSWNKNKAFFQNEADDLGFDIFAASFYLITRYEEYLPHEQDNFGRYDHRESLAHRHGFLQLPLINIWLDYFAGLLQEKFPGLKKQRPAFKPVITYDIDMAWSYKHKGWLRNLGGVFKAQTRNRLKVLLGNKQDPFDCYAKLDELHEGLNLDIIYFFLMAKRRGKFDKNISPSQPAMQALIKRHAAKYAIGLHPSWKSGDDEELLEEEHHLLQNISNEPITASRQHYIRMNLPATYRRLIAANIQSDYSMGYGSINGFRASYAGSFFWYDLEQEQTTSLRIFPFCYMDANSFYEQKQNPEHSLSEILHYLELCRNHKGLFITIFHNHFLGEDPIYEGWDDMHKAFISQLR